MQELLQIIERLSQKVLLVLKRHKELSTKISELKQELSTQEEQNTKLKKTIAKLETEKMLNGASTGTEGKNKDKFKKQIDQMIKTVDKSIEKLSKTAV